MENSKSSLIVVKLLALFLIILFAMSACDSNSDNVQESEGVETISIPQQIEISSLEPAIQQKFLVFDADHMNDGLILHSGGDIDVEEVTLQNSPMTAFQTGSCQVLPADDGNTDYDVALRILIDDGFMYQGLPTSKVQIEVEYLDQGTDQFNIQYDSLKGGPFTDTEMITKTGTNEYRTAVFVLDDAYFGNSQYGGDFRIWDQCDGSEIIRRITVTLLEDDAAVVSSTPESQLGDHASVIFHNGYILTMEGNQIASAIEIQGERIIAVGSESEILANAQPDALMIDLEGRTLMPGFVDTHTHWFNNVWREDFEAGQQILLSNGITTSAEAFVLEPLIRDFQAFEQAGNLRMRISLYPVHSDNCGELLGDWYWEDFPPTVDPESKLHIPGIKIFNDGGSCNLPARSFEYPLGGQGDLYYEAEELAHMILTAQERGYQVIIHGLGDRAIEEIMDAYEIVLAGGPNIFRHRLEHNALVRDDMLPRYTELDLVANIFGQFTGCEFADGTFSASPDPYNVWEWRWRSLLDANPEVHFAWHSDAPWISEPDPMINIYSFLTRRDFRDDGTICEPPQWAVDDVLKIEEILPIMTIEGAYALLRDSEIGSLKAGKFADLIILSDNPLLVSTDDILKIEVLMTMVGGNVEYCASGFEMYCPE